MRTLLILLLSIGLVSAEEARDVEGFVSMMTGQGWKLEEGSGCRGEGGVKMLVFASITAGSLWLKTLTRYQGAGRRSRVTVLDPFHQTE
jgi:hypothetical protein